MNQDKEVEPGMVHAEEGTIPSSKKTTSSSCSSSFEKHHLEKQEDLEMKKLVNLLLTPSPRKITEGDGALADSNNGNASSCRNNQKMPTEESTEESSFGSISKSGSSQQPITKRTSAGKIRNSSSSSSGHYVTHAEKMANDMGIPLSRSDLLFATKLSTVTTVFPFKKKKSKTSSSSSRKSSNPSQDSSKHQFCKFCKITNADKNVPLKVCSLCREVRYCCKEHQVSDWVQHKLLCNAAVRARVNGVYYKSMTRGDEKHRPVDGDMISVHYVARLLNDTIIDRTYQSVQKRQNIDTVAQYESSDEEDEDEDFDTTEMIERVDASGGTLDDRNSVNSNEYKGWLSHVNYYKSRHSCVDEETDSSLPMDDSMSNLSASFSDMLVSLSEDTLSTTTSRYSQSTHATDDTVSFNPNSSEIEDPADNWSSSSSGRGGGTSSSTSVNIIFESAEDVQVVPAPVQFTVGKGQVDSNMEDVLRQMSLGERGYLVVAPGSKSTNILSQRIKKVPTGSTIVYEIMLVHILTNKSQSTTNNNNSENILGDGKNEFSTEEFTGRDNQVYQSCFYEPFRPFIQSPTTL